MIDSNALQALVALLDDPDEQVYDHVRERLLEFGPEAIPFLESSWEGTELGILFQTRIEGIIHEIQFIDCKRQLTEWFQSSAKDLLSGSIIIARYQYPGLNEAALRSFIESMRRDCWLELNPNLTAFENVKILNKVFYEQYGFKGNSKNFHSPLNSYINTVIESKRGNPLSLCILYSVLAQQLQLPIYGVNLPNHFVVAYMDTNGTNQYIENSNEYGVLFYINCFSKGSLFQKEDVQKFLSSINQKPLPEHFQPCSNSDIIRRMLNNLISAYQQAGNEEKVDEITELKQLLD